MRYNHESGGWLSGVRSKEALAGESEGGSGLPQKIFLCLHAGGGSFVNNPYKVAEGGADELGG